MSDDIYRILTDALTWGLFGWALSDALNHRREGRVFEQFLKGGSK